MSRATRVLRTAIPAAVLAGGLVAAPLGALAASNAGTIATLAFGPGTGRAPEIAMTPTGIAVTEDSVLIADLLGGVVREVDRSSGESTTLAGTGGIGYLLRANTQRGWGPEIDGQPATAAPLGYLVDVARDGAGNTYLLELLGRITKVTPGGVISTVLRNPQPLVFGLAGDGGAASQAQIGASLGIAADSSGNLFVSDISNNRVRRIGADGIITTVAGGGSEPPGTNGVPATTVGLNQPAGLDVDEAGNLYVAESGTSLIRRIDPDGVITTVAGTMTEAFDGDGGPATGTRLSRPMDVAVSTDGALVIADSGHNRVRRVDPTGVIRTEVGNGAYPAGNGTDRPRPIDGRDAADLPITPWSVGIGTDGQTVVSQILGRVLTVDAGRKVRTVAGNGHLFSSFPDGIPATQAQGFPGQASTDRAGNVYVADIGSHRIRKVGLDGRITTVAGTGDAGLSGDGGPATAARLRSPIGVMVHPDGSLLIADTGNHRVRRIDTRGVITTIAGSGLPDENGYVPDGYSGDGGPAVQAKFRSPHRVAVDPIGRILIADTGNSLIRRIDLLGRVTTIAGTAPAETADTVEGDPSDKPSGGAATLPFASAFDVAGGIDGSITLRDPVHKRIHRIRLRGGISTTRAGDPEPTDQGPTSGYGGDGGPATRALLNYPVDVSPGSDGSVLVADTNNNRIRRIDSVGRISTIAGNGTAGFGGDGGPAADAALFAPHGVALDRQGRVHIADSLNNRIRMLRRAGTIVTTVGRDTSVLGDGKNAADAGLAAPVAVTFTIDGRMLIADAYNFRVRRVEPAALLPD